MEKIWALINNGVVENLIVAEQPFIDHISEQYDHCIRVDELPVQPAVGWLYDGEFSAPE